MTIYQRMIEAKIPVDNHESDLYVPVNETTTAILKDAKVWCSQFRNQIDGQFWYDMAFMYDPFWDKKAANH